jgi:hypothetical protein
MNLRTMTDDAELLAACEALDACYVSAAEADLARDELAYAEHLLDLDDALEADELDALRRAYDQDRR